MAAIALTRTLHIVCGQHRLIRIQLMISPKVTCIGCLAMWALTFIILTPTTFGVEGFGTFGYDPHHGKCEIKGQKELADVGISPTGWYFLGMSTIPCLIIIVSYVILSLYINVQTSRLSVGLQHEASRVRMVLDTIHNTVQICTSDRGKKHQRKYHSGNPGSFLLPIYFSTTAHGVWSS